MEYRNLGKSGLKISEIGLGGNNFGMRIDEAQSVAVIHQAFDAGVNFIDTADGYGQGHSEEFIGKAVKGRRDEAIIATKFGMSKGSGPNDTGASRQHILRSVEASLKRLDTDYIDVYYIHMPDRNTSIEETLKTLDSLVKAGKVRYIACSNFAAWQLCEAIWTSRVANLESFVVVQSSYNLLDRNIESDVVPCCENYGVGIIPHSPLSGGFLTGKYERGKEAPAGSRLGSMPAGPPPRMANMPRIPARGRYPSFGSPLTSANFEKLEKWQKYAGEHGHTMEQLAIAWLLAHPYVNSVIAGATNPEQVSAHVAAADWKLSSQELDEIDRLFEAA